MADNNSNDCADYDSGCKYFHHEPYMTPNNYDLFFDYNSIPVNIKAEKPHDLRNRLQKLMPLTKFIHLNMDKDTLEEDNNIHLHTNLKISYDVIDESVKEAQLKLTGLWDDLDEKLKSNVLYKVEFIIGNAPLKDVGVSLINVHYPSLYYSSLTDDMGECAFNDLPYGTYVQQLYFKNYRIPPSLVKITDNEVFNKLLIGTADDAEGANFNFYSNGVLAAATAFYTQGELSSSNEDDSYVLGDLTLINNSEGEETPVTVNFYNSGVFVASKIFYGNGVTVSEASGEYDNGELSLNDEEYEDLDDVTVVIDSDAYNSIVDFTAVKVDILGVDSEVVDTVSLNFRNNYVKTSRKLPLYDSNGDKIDYQLSYTQDKFNVDYEYFDVLKFKTNEVMLL